MQYTKLGNTGLDVSRICLGAMGFGDPEGWIHPYLEELYQPHNISGHQ